MVVTLTPLELLYVDIWEPFPISSINGERYFLLVADDNTHFQRIYFLQTKDPAMSLFLKFKTMTEYHNDAKIKSEGSLNLFHPFLTI